jgi:hypothetical protein
MKKILSTLFALLLFAASIFGLVLSIMGINYVLQTDDQFISSSTEGLEIVKETLLTTNEGLVIVQDTLDNARENTVIIGNMVIEVSSTIEGTRMTTEAIGSFFTEDMTDVVEETQTSLIAAQTSAALVDDTLKVISAIPLIGAKYAPSKPLGESIADVSSSLDSLPDAFEEIDQNIEITGNSLYDIELSISELGEKISEIDSTLEDAQTVISDYQEITADLDQRLTLVQDKIPAWIHNFTTVVILLLSWSALVSISMLAQAVLIFQNRKKE